MNIIESVFHPEQYHYGSDDKGKTSNNKMMQEGILSVKGDGNKEIEVGDIVEGHAHIADFADLPKSIVATDERPTKPRTVYVVRFKNVDNTTVFQDPQMLTGITYEGEVIQRFP